MTCACRAGRFAAAVCDGVPGRGEVERTGHQIVELPYKSALVGVVLLPIHQSVLPSSLYVLGHPDCPSRRRVEAYVDVGRWVGAEAPTFHSSRERDADASLPS